MGEAFECCYCGGVLSPHVKSCRHCGHQTPFVCSVCSAQVSNEFYHVEKNTFYCRQHWPVSCCICREPVKHCIDARSYRVTGPRGDVLVPGWPISCGCSKGPIKWKKWYFCPSHQPHYVCCSCGIPYCGPQAPQKCQCGSGQFVLVVRNVPMGSERHVCLVLPGVRWP